MLCLHSTNGQQPQCWGFRCCKWLHFLHGHCSAFVLHAWVMECEGTSIRAPGLPLWPPWNHHCIAPVLPFLVCTPLQRAGRRSEGRCLWLDTSLPGLCPATQPLTEGDFHPQRKRRQHLPLPPALQTTNSQPPMLFLRAYWGKQKTSCTTMSTSGWIPPTSMADLAGNH